MGLITEASDQELEQYRRAIVAEQGRRQTLATAEKQATELNTAYLAASGVEPGQEWRQPQAAFDAYPQGWTVEHSGRMWESLIEANVFEPGVSSWREVSSEGEVPEWVQPSGATDAYNSGDLVTFEGAVYKCVIDNCVWSPTDYPQGWEKQ